ncbi:L-tyrosine/L-tryptophan isonitrile synthase family protein [Legionella cincinnatiensis]|uniref:Pyoverdine biosynthesis protein PvcA n=1 Tax=Legionella cincinnatiensis TaxID=28085 RepID=A0A378INL8_9GAMM|nr:L-tyrosine/L-tryptophan isonitrile synthase family protein [Legionella cincinnatiensis]KTC83963.1 pyoverdine biosynthesis protein PvcA [Legionella cincinnatiensis]STX36255.1 pyoverdine biosynthesis protein PvcA [Legionella cincinnatiensis]
MKDETLDNTESTYQIGLNKKREAVISAHFMHEINHKSHFQLYSSQEFTKNAVSISENLFFEHLLPALLQASEKFILERVSAASIRAKKNYKNYGLQSPDNIGISEEITEVMFDRQFLKGSKANSSRIILSEKIRTLVKEKKPIKMVIPALPYKSSSPLKSRGPLPDLSEINFLLGLYEIAKTIDSIYRKKAVDANRSLSSFTIICDGRRFNQFLNESEEIIDLYQTHLCWWIKKLNIANYIEIIDYQEVILDFLPSKMQLEKATIRAQVHDFYLNLMQPLLDPYDMPHALYKAIEADPDPELCNPEGRYIPLFKSLIYTINYTTLLNYARIHKKNYEELYVELTKHLFEPYTRLTATDFKQVETFITNTQAFEISQAKLFEYLRQSMIQEAWNATICYLAEVRSDRDLPQEPISTCFPDHIRWTIHAKPGQLAVLITTAFGDPVQPWHGIGVFMRTKNNKIKLYTLPVLALEGSKAIPVLMENRGIEQPLFYVYPDIKFKSMDDLLEKIKQGLTRKRKH